MPQGCNAASGRFVKVVNEVIEGLERIVAYLGEVSKSLLSTRTPTPTCRKYIRALEGAYAAVRPEIPSFERDCRYLGHTISPASVRPNAK